MEGGLRRRSKGRVLVAPSSTDVYVGMVAGSYSRDNDLNVNVCKNKKLTNVRSSGADGALNLTPVRNLTLEDALEYISQLAGVLSAVACNPATTTPPDPTARHRRVLISS